MAATTRDDIARVAHDFAAMCRAGRNLEAIDRYYASDVVSIEPADMGDLPRELRGIEAVRGKNVWWFENNELHAATVNGPYIGEDGFALHFEFEVTPKATGQRRLFTEMARYDLRNGRVAREQFFYDVPNG